MKVKIITDCHESLEEKINEFLQNNKNQIEVIDMKWKVYAMTHWVMIVYNEKNN